MIVIDNIIFYLQQSGGVSVVWSELIERLNRCCRSKVVYIEYQKPPNNIFYAYLNIASKQIVRLRLLCLNVQRYFPVSLLFMNEPHVFHSSYYRYSKNPAAINVTTVHDFTYEYFVKGIKSKLHIWQKHRAIRHSDHIICISENTKKDLLKFLPDINSSLVKVIYNGVSEDYFVLLSDNNSYKLPFPQREYIVFVGSRVGYKNFDLGVDSISESSYNLVIVGTPLSKWEIKMLDSKLGKDRYYYSGRIPNSELNMLYNHAFALLYPSSYEGFGIPVLEAQKAGCPVIAYNSSSIPEIIGDTSLLFNKLNVEEIQRCFRILESDSCRKDIILKGIINSKRFTWDQMYKQVMIVYDEAFKSKLK